MAGTNELFVYNLFKNILSKSLVIEGRVFLIKTLGNEVNTSTFGDLITDALGGLDTPKKYPCVLVAPPRETEVTNNKGWSTLHFNMYFLTLDKRTGDGDIKTVNTDTNTSQHTEEMDWKDMREVAGNFRQMLRKTLMRPDVKVLRENSGYLDIYNRISSRANDRVNGIQLTMELQLYNGYNCETLADYAPDTLIEIPSLNPHPLHKQ